MNEIESKSAAGDAMGYRPRMLTLTGFRGIKDGLGRDEVTLDLTRWQATRNWSRSQVPTGVARPRS